MSREKDILLTNSEAANRLRISLRQWHRIKKLAPLTVDYIGSSPRYSLAEIMNAKDKGLFDLRQTGQQSMARAATATTRSA